MKQFYFVLLASIGLVGLTDGRDQRPQRIGDSCTPYNPEKTELSYDLCESVPANDYANYCDYQRRTCQPRRSGCNMGDQAIGCRWAKRLVQIANTTSCPLVEDEREKKKCVQVIKGLEMAEEEACNTALRGVCSRSLCPENYFKTPCKEFR